MNQQKEIWFQVKKTTPHSLIEKTFHLSYSTLLVAYKDITKLEKLKLPSRMSIAVQIKTESELDEFLSCKNKKDQYKYVVFEDHYLVSKCKNSNYKIGLFYCVNDKKSLDTVVDTAKEVDIVVINFSDPTNIPLELVLATTQKANTQVFKLVNQSLDGQLSMLTMEHGSDGIVLSTNNLQDIVDLDGAFIESDYRMFKLEPAQVVSVQHAGMGTRVCVDTTSELHEDEGMILGSTSTGGIFTCSETHYLPYMDLRPFRVNAGGLHLYVWGPEKVVYLSDLKAGDKVYAFNSKGKARIVTVGRLKVERRPLLKIEARLNDKTINTFIQDDWHVRIMGSKGEIRPSSEIAIGDEILALKDVPGRHVGIAIDETIAET